MRKQRAIAICGLKNTGKSTVIESILPVLTGRGCKVAVIKHDAHDFEADRPGTDTYRYKEAGAYATAIYSKNQYMLVKEQRDTTAEQLMDFFPEADLIIIEGLKYSHFPKIELVRGCISENAVCDPKTVIAYVSDGMESSGVPVFAYDEPERIADAILEFIKQD